MSSLQEYLWNLSAQEYIYIGQHKNSCRDDADNLRPNSIHPVLPCLFSSNVFPA